MKNKNLISWLLYDSANSFLHTALGGLFLAQWIVIDHKFDDIWYGATFSIATVLVLLTSPFLGAWSDRIGKRLPFVKFLTILLIAFDAILVIIAPSSLSNEIKIMAVLVLATLLQYFYQQSLVFYNALLETISSVKNRGKISGLGELFGNLGWISAAAIFLPFASGKITIFGETGRAQIFLPAFIFFTVLSLPIFKFKEIPKKISIVKIRSLDVIRQTATGIVDLFRKNRNVGLFLISFSLISDVILTTQLYFAIFMQSIYGIPDNQKFFIILLMYIPLLIFDYIWGKLSDKIGSKPIIIFSCLSLILTLSIAYLSSTQLIMYILAPMIGIGWAGFYVATRSIMVTISPPKQLGEYFGFFSTFQRFASITGPIIWGTVTLLLKDYGATKYRVAGLALIFVMLMGIIILTKVKEERSYTVD